jgi:hypothetical protein
MRKDHPLLVPSYRPHVGTLGGKMNYPCNKCEVSLICHTLCIRDKCLQYVEWCKWELKQVEFYYTLSRFRFRNMLWGTMGRVVK